MKIYLVNGQARWYEDGQAPVDAIPLRQPKKNTEPAPKTKEEPVKAPEQKAKKATANKARKAGGNK